MSNELAEQKYTKYDKNSAADISFIPKVGLDYFSQLLRVKMESVSSRIQSGTLLDIGCANGTHLASLSVDGIHGVGVDITSRYLEYARREHPDQCFMKADVRQLPFAADMVDCLYAFSCLYCVPDLERAYHEMYRVLKPGGIAILDVGNMKSINYGLSVEYSGKEFLQRHTHKWHQDTLKKAGLKIVDKRYFQILPYWGSSSGIRRLFINSRWKKLMQRKLGSRMLDEIISSLPLFRRYAFRCLVTCQKDAK